MRPKKIIKISITALILVLISDFIVVLSDLSISNNYYLIHHYLGGFFVAMFFYGYLSDIMTARSIKWMKKWLVIIGATLFIGVLWEFGEYISANSQFEFLVKFFRIGDLDDTIADLFVDGLGAITMLVLHPLWSRKSH